MGKSTELGMFVCSQKTAIIFGICGRLFLKKAGKKQNWAPMWKKLMKNIDLDEPTSFLDRVYLGCTQRECRADEMVIEKNKEMFESRISAGATEKLPGWENLTRKRTKMCGKVLRIGE